MIVLIVNGAPEAGKSTFMRLLNKLTKQRVASYSSIDWVKDIAKVMGWDGIKDEKGRQFLYDVKQASIMYDDIPTHKVMTEIEKYRLKGNHDFICVDIREPEEIFKLKNICKTKDIRCYSVLIRNTKAEKKLAASDINNPADTQTCSILYDIVLLNNSSLTRYKRQIQEKYDMIQRDAIIVKDRELAERVNKAMLQPEPPKDGPSNSDMYQALIGSHYAELPKPHLDQDAIMLLINALGLCGESGEIANLVKKITWYRNGNLTEDDISQLRGEIGDNLYHAAQLATIIKSKLSDIMNQNAVKCIEREKQGFEQISQNEFKTVCTACNGRGWFAAPDDIREKCKSCQGTGLNWLSVPNKEEKDDPDFEL